MVFIGCKIVYGRRKVPDMVRAHFHWWASNASPLLSSNPSELPKIFDDRRKSAFGPLEWKSESNVNLYIETYTRSFNPQQLLNLETNMILLGKYTNDHSKSHLHNYLSTQFLVHIDNVNLSLTLGNKNTHHHIAKKTIDYVTQSIINDNIIKWHSYKLQIY